MKNQILLLFLIFVSVNYAQEMVIRGKITNAANGEDLIYANVKVDGTASGATANIEGDYEIRIKAGNYKLIASYIGFQSDTINVTPNKTRDIDFSLQPISIELPQITVRPGVNPAIELINRTIKTKNARNENLNSYIVDSYTKGIVRTTSELSSHGSGISVGLSDDTGDSTELGITGLIENTSRSYYRKPNDYKDNIVAQKQSANFPAQINIFTGGRLIQNFYSDDVQFMGSQVTSPISDDALDYYYYMITDTLAYDILRVIEVECEPIDDSDPGFLGKLYIIDSLYTLAKVDVTLNDAANPGGIFKELRVFQQFQIYNNISMPVDYRLSGLIEILSLVKLGFDLSSVLYSYEINPAIEDDVFDMASITVSPGADKKDSLYWNSVQTIPNTLEEIKAYQKIDSLEAVPKTFWDNFNFLSARISFNENFSIAGPLWMYHFNRVEGNTLEQGLYFFDALEKRLNSSLDFSYGFADKKFKYNFWINYLLGDYRTTTLSFSAFNKLDILFGESDEYNSLTSTLTNLLGKYDFRDYFYTKGFDFSAGSDVLPFLRLNAGFINRTDATAIKNSDFSIFNKSKTYEDNPPVNNVKINAVTAGFRFDFRKYIEDGYFRRRISNGNSFAVLSGEIIISKKSSLKSDIDFEIYNIELAGILNSFRSTNFDFNLKATQSNGPVPLQMLYALPGNISGAGKNSTFRTLRTSEIFGDKVVSLNIIYNMRDELFRMLNIPVLEDSRLILNPYFNAAWVELSDKTKNYIPASFTEFKNPLIEVGFGIGHMMFPIVFEFTWRLNHRTGNNFVFGINTFAL